MERSDALCCANCLQKYEQEGQKFYRISFVRGAFSENVLRDLKNTHISCSECIVMWQLTVANKNDFSFEEITIHNDSDDDDTESCSSDDEEEEEERRILFFGATTVAGYNVDESPILNKASVERGLFRTNNISSSNYAVAIEKDGMPKIGATVMNGDTLIGEINFSKKQ